MLTERYNSALAYALRAHRQQTRKGSSIPYFSHLMGVSSLVLEYNGTEDQAIAALLHDVVEDCGIQHEQVIRDRFGSVVVQIVMDCTDSVTFPKPAWKKRKSEYISSLDHKADSSLLVSCCDKIHNARAIDRDYREVGDVLWERFTSGKSDIEWYYRELTEKYLQREVLAARELELVVNSVFR